MSITTSYLLESAWESGANGDGHTESAGGYLSPFTVNELTGESAAENSGPVSAHAALLSEYTSPFREAAGFETDHEIEREGIESLVANFADDEFAEALEVLTQEAAARHAASAAQWSSDTMMSESAAADVGHWLQTLAEQADERLASLAEAYGERTIESLSEVELDHFGGGLSTEASPVDAQQGFLGALVRKVKKIARGVAKLAKKGLSTLGRLLPISKLLAAVRRLIRPLLKNVLRRAIGRLPAPLQPAAKRLAQRLGLGERADLVSESVGERLSDEFDAQLAEHLLEPDRSAGEMQESATGSLAESDVVAERSDDPVVALDAARGRLAQYFETAEHQADPTAEMHQFIPAVLPLVKLGVSVVGRDRVVKLVAGLISNLIRPMVGQQLAPVLSQHIASSGLSLIGLEATAGEGPRIGSDALVSVAEDTIHEVFAAGPAVLGNELLTAAVTRDAFTDAVSRYLPTELVREEIAAERGDDERGVWVAMPRRGGRYRYRAYSRPLRITITRPMARQIVLNNGESLEDRLLEAGVESFPAEADVEAFETLPGGEVGHIVGEEHNESGATAIAELTSQFEELGPVSSLNLLLPPSVSAMAIGRPAHRGPHRRYVRMRVHGTALRRRSLLSMHLVLDSARPLLTVTVRLGEHQAHVMASRLAGKGHIGVVGEFQAWVRGRLQGVLARKLRRSLVRHHITAPVDTTDAARRIGDALAAAFAARMPAAAPQLAAAAKDPAQGISLVFGLTFDSRNAIISGSPSASTFAVLPGWRHG